MKRFIPMIILSFFIIIGISFLIVVLRMVWFPQNSMGMMGMMMGRNMMFHHMFLMFCQTFGILMIIMGLLIFLWVFKKKKRKL